LSCNRARSIARRAVNSDLKVRFCGTSTSARFLPGADGERPRSAYLPFGGGRRSCIGQTFALMEMVLMASIMSQQFNFELRPGYPVELEATLTLQPNHGLHVIGPRRTS
jgi:cytochrome P450